MSDHPVVVLRLPNDDVVAGSPVLAAALALFSGRSVELSLVIPDIIELTAELGAAVGEWCTSLAVDDMPSISLDLEDEIGAKNAVADFTLSGEVVTDSRIIAALVALQQELASFPAIHEDCKGYAAVLPARDQLLRHRDAMADAAGHGRILIAAIAQVQSTWWAIDGVCRELMKDPRVDLVVVAVESDHEIREQSTAAFITGLGFQVEDATWLESQLSDTSSPLRLVVCYDPWDSFRPESISTASIAQAGVRMVHLPYGNPVGGGREAPIRNHNTPLHNLAWRVFVRSESQFPLYERYCDAGSKHVRALGISKADRVAKMQVEGTPLSLPSGYSDKPSVLWNPHFTVGEGGFSTFLDYTKPLLDYASEHSDFVLIMRPHFRLFVDLPQIPGGSALLRHLEESAMKLPNVVLDTSPDYIPAFLRAHALISDVSSLVTEFLPTGKPILYTHRSDGPGLDEDSQYFFELEVATDFAEVERFLDRVRRREDIASQRKRLTIERHFPYTDGGASARISDEILSSLRNEGVLAEDHR